MIKTIVEFIESYIKDGNGDYQWRDNHGELIRCKDCKYWNANSQFCERLSEGFIKHRTPPDWYCADGERTV